MYYRHLKTEEEDAETNDSPFEQLPTSGFIPKTIVRHLSHSEKQGHQKTLFPF